MSAVSMIEQTLFAVKAILEYTKYNQDQSMTFAMEMLSLNRTHYCRGRFIESIPSSCVQKAGGLCRIVDTAVSRIGVVKCSIREPRLPAQHESVHRTNKIWVNR